MVLWILSKAGGKSICQLLSMTFSVQIKMQKDNKMSTKISTQTSKWATYQAYKDSGIEWLGEIPEGWQVKRLKYSSTLMNQKIDGSKTDLQYTGLENIQPWTGKRITSDFDTGGEGLSNTYMRGDILFGKLRPYLAKALIANKDGICTGELLVLRPVNINTRFLLNYLLTPNIISIVDSSTYGAKMPRANWDFIGNLPTLLPPKHEQTAIATFLDRETFQIDALIEKKKRQIELLKEKRSALISHAVTKGLDPKAKMKDSGIEWLGEIPEGWQVLRLKHIAKVNFSNVDKHTVEGEKSIRLCNYVDVYYNDYISEDFELMHATATKAEIEKFTLKSGDVIITKDSEAWDDIAVSAYVPEDMPSVLCGYHLARIRTIENQADGKYLFRAFCSHSINYQFKVVTTGVTRYGLGKYGLDNALFVVPSKKEQTAIANFLDLKTAQIDALIDKVQKSIDLLREKRSALITAAVTGKIDVREKAA